MAKAGKKVLVLERKPHYGGGVSTRELTVPGYLHDEHSSVHIMIQGNPMLRSDELGLLSKFGLKYHYSPLPLVSIFEDGRTILTYKDLDRTCQSIAAISPRDAEAYRAFVTKSMSLLPMFMAGMYAPPAPLGPFMAMLDQSEEGRFLLDLMSRSALDVACRYFESDLMRIHLVRCVTENLQMPDELGTGLGVLLFPGIMHAYGVSQPIGGSGKLSEALVRCIEHYGGEVRCNAEVRKVTTSGGRATGVEMSDGERLAAKDAVIGALHPRIIGHFVDGIPAPVLERAKNVTPSTFSILLTHLALREKARYRAGDHCNDAVMVELLSSPRLADMLEDYDHLRRGRVPPRRLCAGGEQSRGDTSRAPPGAGVFYGVTFAPYELADGGAARWDEVKEQVADESVAYFRRFYSNLGDDNILGRAVRSPLDHERDSPTSFIRGDVHGCAPFMYQSMAHRPTPDFGNYGVPGVERLYLVGPFMHPGGGVFGAGRGTAIRMMEDLRIDSGKIMAAPVR
jgi:phytoene dehydrogenase-like protein